MRAAGRLPCALWYLDGMSGTTSSSGPAASSGTYELLETADDGTRARIRFRGPFEDREVIWDARLYALRVPQPIAPRPFFEIAPPRKNGFPIRIGLDVERLDAPTLRKAVIMVRQYKRLRRGRHAFGETVAVVRKIVSGGQTGVDRAALDAALALGIACGGWCPRNRRAEDGRIPARYPLTETPAKDYRVRTRRNVRDSDGTLILVRGPLSGGTALTLRLAMDMAKPSLVVDLARRPRAVEVHAWLSTHRIRVLNVAGPRESSQPGISLQAKRFLHRILGN